MTMKDKKKLNLKIDKDCDCYKMGIRDLNKLEKEKEKDFYRIIVTLVKDTIVHKKWHIRSVESEGEKL